MTTLSAEAQLRFDLALIHRYMAEVNWNEGVVNHLTAMMPDSSERFLALPYGLHWSEVKSSDFLVVDCDGNVCSGVGRIEPSNLNIHGAIHRKIPKARAILHSHQPNITALTLLEDQTVLMVSQHALRFSGRIAHLDTYGDPGNPEIGDAIVDSMKTSDVLMCANHGVIVARPSLWDAFDDLYFLDRACEVQLMAMNTGKRIRVIPEEKATALGKAVIKWSKDEGEQHFIALRRLYLKKYPELID
ncbi:MAG: class II aldolase/adducin family protein [Motiliproteus sp.]